jgi:glycosyltransferase involved in cell wall biosynthesis
MEPIATSVAARGHEVHVVAPWHPAIERPALDRGVRFHFYKYAPFPSLNVFGYAASMHADVTLRAAAYVAAPLALAAGWWTARRVARRYHASVMHGHWVVPTALGADPRRTGVVPYGVDADRFRPVPQTRFADRQQLGVPENTILIATAGRLVHKKGFEYLIDATATVSDVILAIAGEGSLREELEQRARERHVMERVRFLGNRTQDDVAALFAAADLIVTPSVRDDSGNVDGLPNVVMEALASGTALITTAAGGIGAVVDDDVTAAVVPERDVPALSAAIRRLGSDVAARARLGSAARGMVEHRFGWAQSALQFENAYRDALAFTSARR